jgi:hypothetical protein
MQKICGFRAVCFVKYLHSLELELILDILKNWWVHLSTAHASHVPKLVRMRSLRGKLLRNTVIGNKNRTCIKSPVDEICKIDFKGAGLQSKYIFEVLAS